MLGFCIRFSYSVIVKKRKVICMLNYLTKCSTPFLGQRFLKLDFSISDTPHSPRALEYIILRDQRLDSFLLEIHFYYN